VVHNRWFTKVLGFLALWCGWLSFNLSAAQCSATYVDGLTSNSNGGSIVFGKNSMITGNPDLILATPSVDSSSQGASCQSADCTSGGTAVPTMSLGVFQSTSSSTPVTVPKNGAGTIGYSGTNQYDEVKVEQGAVLTANSGYSEYFFQKLTISKNAVVNLPAGDYWINDLSTTQGMSINISGAGTIRLFINNSATFEKNSAVNGQGSSSNLFIYSYSDVIMGEGAHIKGYVYAQATITTGKNSLITGGASAADIITGQGSQIAYKSADITNTDFGSACTNGVTIDHYEISHDSVGATCAAESVTIKACVNADCSSLLTSAVSLNFQANGTTKSSPSFTGSTTFTYSHISAETLTLSIDSPSKTPDNALVCDDGTGTSCDIVFSSDSCAAGGECAVYFPDSIQGNDASSVIKFKNNGKVISDGDNVLTFPTLTDETSGGHNTCNTVDCTISTATSPPITLPTFETTSVTTDLTLASGTVTIGTGGDHDMTEIDQLIVQGTSNVTFIAPGDKYVIKSAWFKDTAEITMNAGVYWFDFLEITGDIELIINGSVTIYVNQHFDIENNAQINANGAAQNLVFVGYEQIHLKNDVVAHAVLYGAGNDVHIQNQAALTGAISASGKLEIKNDATVTFEDVSNVTVGGVCTGTPVEIDHFEIIHDSAGSTCADESVTIKACANVDCSALVTASVSVDFQADGVTKNSASFTGTTTFSYSHTTAESLTLSVANPSSTPDNPLVCDDGSGTSCDILFSSTGCPTAGSCTAFFPDSIQGNSSSSQIKFKNTGKIISDGDSVLTFPNITDDTAGSHNTCNTTDCTITGSTSPALVLPAFETTSTSTDLNIASGTVTIGSGGDHDMTQVDEMTINGSANVTFLAPADKHVIDSAWFNGSAVITLNEGEYWFDFLEILDSVELIINGPVTIYVNQHFDIEDTAQINVSGAAQDLVFVGYDKIHLKNDVVVHAVLYGVGDDVHIQNQAALTGAISASGKVEIKNTATVTFENVSNTQVGDICGGVGSNVDHYRLLYDGTALTCAAETITIKACANSDCTTPYASATTVTFSASIPLPATSSTALTFTDSATIEVGESSETTVTLSLPATSPSGTSALQCYKDSVLDSTCSYYVDDTGFLFINDTDIADPVNKFIIPTQLSNKSSATGYNQKTLSFQAVQLDPVSASCVPLFVDGTTVAVDLAYQCENPSDCSGSPVTMINDGNQLTLGKYETYTTHNVLFGADAKATFSFIYPEAGQIKLHAKKAIELVPDETKTMIGSSNSFVVRPFGLKLDLAGDLTGTAADVNGTVFRKAGEAFSVTATAVRWVSGEDSVDNNGQPDDLTSLNDNATAANFSSEIFKLTHAVEHPTDAPATGTLAGSTVSELFSASVAAVADITWDEVGIITLNAGLSDADYLGTGNVYGQLANVGRFVPDHFTLVNGGVVPTCGAFTYMGQPFNLQLQVEARNSANGITTNYKSGHDKGVLSYVAENDIAGIDKDLTARLAVPAQVWANGSINTVVAATIARDAFNAADNPAQIDEKRDPLTAVFVGLQIDDGESEGTIELVDLVGGALDMNAAVSGGCGGSCDALNLQAAGIEMRYGRLNSLPTYGPITQ
jgi:hypothetical protein